MIGPSYGRCHAGLPARREVAVPGARAYNAAPFGAERARERTAAHMAARTKAAAKSTRSSAKKVQADKSTAKAAGGKAATKRSSSAKAASKGAPAKQAAAKKTPAKKAVAKNAAARPTPAKKAPAKAPAKAASPHRSRSFATQAEVKKAPPKRKGPLDKFLLGQLASLREERETYSRQAESLRAEADLLAAEREPGDVQFDEESGEGDTLAVERERDLTLSAQATAAVEEIDRAIAKLDEGTYGVCEVCNSTIPKERLRALPYAALCVQCKSAGFSRR